MKWLWIGLWMLGLPAWAASDVVRLGLESHKPPYIFEGEARGLEYEIVTAALREADLQYQVRHAPAARLQLLLESGAVDAISGTDRLGSEHAYLSAPYLSAQNMAVALSRNDLNIRQVADLEKYSIGSFQRARYVLGADFLRMVARNNRYHELPSHVNSRLMLYADRVQVVISDPLVFAYLRGQMPASEVEPELRWYGLFEPNHYQVGFRDKDMRDRFDQGLRRLQDSGAYQEILQRYLPANLSAQR